MTTTTTGIDWRGMTHLAGFGATVTLAARLNIPSTVNGFMPQALGSFRGDAGNILTFGALLWIYEGFIWPTLSTWV